MKKGKTMKGKRPKKEAQIIQKEETEASIDEAGKNDK